MCVYPVNSIKAIAGRVRYEAGRRIELEPRSLSIDRSIDRAICGSGRNREKPRTETLIAKGKGAGCTWGGENNLGGRCRSFEDSF